MDQLVTSLGAQFQTSDVDKIASVTQTLNVLQQNNDPEDAEVIAVLKEQKKVIRARLLAASHHIGSV